jgi:glutathione synthase/RimK-type ligase-like ATP-grasp enzyme
MCTSRDELALGGREVTAEVCDERWASSQRWRNNFSEGGMIP